MTDLSHAVWRKARRSQHNGGCVEVAANLDEVVAVRDSKRPEARRSRRGPGCVRSLPGDAKAGRFDLEPTTR